MLLVTAIFTLAVLALAHDASGWALAVYALSFWQYAVYAFAFFFREIPLERFKRDSVTLKVISLSALAFAMLQTTPNLASLTVMAAGFGLNLAAAMALGPDRTYYGVEVAGMPFERTNAFPFSLLAHPMLVGNMIGYAGPLLDAEFRLVWWPLASLHILLNFLVIQMEVRGGKSHFNGVVWPCGGLMLGSIVLLISFTEVWQSAIAVAILSLAFGAFLLRRYAKFGAGRKLKETPS